MASFAKLGTGNKVIRVNVLHNNVASTEQAGVEFLQNLYGSRDAWKQTFTDGTRKNPASKNYTYDESRDAFIAPKPYASWVLNEDTCQWEAPSARPDDGKDYSWNESTKTWDEIVS